MKNKIAYFTMGISGSGKSSFIDKNLPGIIHLDSDKIKENLKGYNPLNPSLVHKRSKEILARQFKKILKGNKSFCYDGTGTNAENLLYRIDKARKKGFKIILIYCKTTLKLALIRNKLRARQVPEDIIKDKARLIKYSFSIVKNYADKIIIVDNTKKEFLK
jgi:predicted kinase